MNIDFFESLKDKAELVAFLKTMDFAHNATEAEIWIRNQLPAEGAFQRRIMKHLQHLRENGKIGATSIWWKNTSGAYARGGLPDIFAIIDGKFYAFEVKRPFVGVVSALQRKSIKEINEAGGIAGVVIHPRDVDELIFGR